MISQGVSHTDLFPSGIATANMAAPAKLQRATGYDGTNFINLPGLRNVERGRESITALAESLQNDGEFRIIFVIKLAAGKLQSSDMENIKMVLQSSPDIRHYGVVINQLSQKVLSELTQENNRTAITEKIQDKACNNANPQVFFLPRYDDKEDQDNTIINCPQLIEFFDSVQSNEIHGNHFNPLPFSYPPEDQVNALKHYLNEKENIIRTLNEQIEIYQRGLSLNIYKTNQ